MSRRERFERLLPDDLARARAADEPFHAAVGEDDRVIAEVRRHRRAPGHDRRHGERLPFAPQRRDPLEEVDHPCYQLTDRGSKALEHPRRPGLQRLEPAGQLPLKLDRDEPRRPHVAPPLVLEQAVQQRRTSHHRATAPLSPAAPDTPTESALQAGGRRTILRQQHPVGSSVTTASLRTGGPDVGRKMLAQQRHEPIGRRSRTRPGGSSACASWNRTSCGLRCAMPGARSRDRSPGDPREAG